MTVADKISTYFKPQKKAEVYTPALSLCDQTASTVQPINYLWRLEAAVQPLRDIIHHTVIGALKYFITSIVHLDHYCFFCENSFDLLSASVVRKSRLNHHLIRCVKTLSGTIFITMGICRFITEYLANCSCSHHLALILKPVDCIVIHCVFR